MIYRGPRPREFSTGPITMRFSAAAHLSDVRALLDSYAFELWKHGWLWRAGPLHVCELAEDDAAFPPLTPIPVFDKSLDLRLVRYAPTADQKDLLAGIRERSARWPVWVEYPVAIVFTLGDQWWQYQFTPGNTYEERTVTRDLAINRHGFL